MDGTSQFILVIYFLCDSLQFVLVIGFDDDATVIVFKIPWLNVEGRMHGRDKLEERI